MKKFTKVLLICLMLQAWGQPPWVRADEGWANFSCSEAKKACWGSATCVSVMGACIAAATVFSWPCWGPLVACSILLRQNHNYCPPKDCNNTPDPVVSPTPSPTPGGVIGFSASNGGLEVATNIGGSGTEVAHQLGSDSDSAEISGASGAATASDSSGGPPAAIAGGRAGATTIGKTIPKRKGEKGSESGSFFQPMGDVAAAISAVKNSISSAVTAGNSVQDTYSSGGKGPEKPKSSGLGTGANSTVVADEEGPPVEKVGFTNGTGSVLKIDDPDDYFTRIGIEENLFEVVHRRYQHKSKSME